VPHYEEPIAVTIRSATHATQLVGFYVAYCKHCRKKSFASPFSGIAQFYAGLTFSKNDIGTLKQGLQGHIKADLKAVEAVESPARAHQWLSSGYVFFGKRECVLCRKQLKTFGWLNSSFVFR
jgi:hypothetical protein